MYGGFQARSIRRVMGDCRWPTSSFPSALLLLGHARKTRAAQHPTCPILQGSEERGQYRRDELAEVWAVVKPHRRLGPCTRTHRECGQLGWLVTSAEIWPHRRLPACGRTSYRDANC